MPDKKPTFLVIGSQKAGTTSLYHVLNQHPQVYMPARKEVNFFFHPQEYGKGKAYYQGYFDDAPPEALALGEASPGYIVHPLAPSRIQDMLPDVKLILTVRHPIDRAYSQYWDNRRSLSEYRTFSQAVEAALEDTYYPDRLGYFSRGTYIQYILRYLELFPRENLLVLPFDDLLADAEGFYRRVFEFIGVDPSFASQSMDTPYNPAAIWHNPIYRWLFARPGRVKFLPAKLRRLAFWGRRTPWKYPPMNPELRARLVDFYRPWNQRLAQFLGRDLSHWDQ